MIETVKSWIKARWPAVPLRAILFGVLLFAAAMPGISAIGLRVYENTLVRQTEAELVAQGAAIAATAAALWPGAHQPMTAVDTSAPGYYRPEPSTVDLRTSPVLPERPDPPAARRPIDPAARTAGETLAPIIASTTRTTLAAVLVLDRAGVVAVGPEAGGDLGALPEVREALAGRPATVLRRNGAYRSRSAFEWLSRASDLRLHHARPILVDGRVAGVLLLSRSPRALFRGLYEDRGKFALAAVVIFGLLVAMAGLVSRGITRPIEGLSAASREVADGRGTIPETPATAAVEIRALYDDFRAMAEAIERRSSYLRDFAAAVSHEFKTPLAGIRGAVELLQDHDATLRPDERLRFLDTIAASNQRLSHLVTRLLDLARADMARPRADAAADVKTTLRRLADSQAVGALTIDDRSPAVLPPVAMPEAAFEAVLGILIDNSLKAGASRLTIAAREEARSLALTLADNGTGVPAGDRGRVFDAFFTSRRATGGTGLGLPIARSLLAASHGRIALIDGEAGALFEIVLPIAG